MTVFPYLKTCVISDYTSKEDLVQAIATSCHIPAYNDGSFVKEFRGQVRAVCVRGPCTLDVPRAVPYIVLVCLRGGEGRKS
eukprot:1157884-Pelagomonas_calceolata.AAC.16